MKASAAVTSHATGGGANLGLKQWVEQYRTEWLPLYSLLAETLKEILTKALKEARISALMQGRAKGIPNFAEKMVRKKYLDPFTEMTDLCGVRIITQSEEETTAACALVRSLFVIDEKNSGDTMGRLGHSEFGYRSVHLIVSLPEKKSGGLEHFQELQAARDSLLRLHPQWEPVLATAAKVLGQKSVVPGRTGLALPAEPRFKAEIQIRTLLQHAWATTSHDQLYKGDFQAPAHLRREAARASALLEQVESSFSRIARDLQIFSTYHGPYRSDQERQEEIKRLREVFPFDRSLRLALRICRIASSLQKRPWKMMRKLLQRFIDDWKQSVKGQQFLKLAAGKGHVRRSYEQEKFDAELKALQDPERARALMRYGQALWATAENSRDKTNARRHLEWSALLDQELADAHTAIGDTFRDQHLWHKALEHYQRAIQIASVSGTVNPRAWRKFLVAKIIAEGNLSFVPALVPALDSAIEVCRKRARIKVYLPQGYFDIGLFYLAQNRPYDALSAYARAITLCESASQIVSPFHQIEKIRQGLARGSATAILEPIDWVRQLLVLALHAKSKRSKHHQQVSPLEPLRTKDKGRSLKLPKKGSVLMVVGGTLESEQERIEAYYPLLQKALAGFSGIIFCGGTSSGISGVIGRLPLGPGARRIAYLPRKTPDWTCPDSEHYELFRTKGQSFSPREVLQNWIDLVASGISPARVRLVGINGGPIAALEFRIALALGAKAGVFPESGRAATAILRDEDWLDTPGLCSLPQDSHTITEFVRRVPSQKALLGNSYRLQEAMKGHEEYRHSRLKDFAGHDPALKPWKDLDEHYQGSNLARIDHIVLKLSEIGMKLQKGRSLGAKKVVLTTEQLELLAAMEHGRWNAEKLLDGWKWAEQTKKEAKLHSLLVPWSEVPEYAKKWDRDPLVQLLEALQEKEFTILPVNNKHIFVPVEHRPGLYYILPQGAVLPGTHRPS